MAQREKAGRGTPPTSHGGGHEGHHGPPGGHGHGAEKAGHIAAKNVTPQEKRFLEEHQHELSPTTLRAKWIHSEDEHEDHAGQSLATQSHAVIQHWAEERGGQPATVPGTEHGNRPGVLRFNFPGYGGQGLQPVSWDDWFKTFDSRHLIFVFQEHKTDGRMSNFFQLDSPEREHD